MRRHVRSTGLAVAIATAGMLAFGAPARAADAPLSPWRDPVVLAKRLAEACDVVEAETGSKFQKRPTVRIATAKEFAEALTRAEDVLGITEKTDPAEVSSNASFLFALCDYPRNQILVGPDAVDQAASSLSRPTLPSEDVLRVMLFHEATHALDWPRFRWIEHRGTHQGDDEAKAFEAIAEGHAQFVAQRAASARGLSAAFADLTAAFASLPSWLTPEQRHQYAGLLAQRTFVYVQGHRFFQAVFQARGRAGVDEALAKPPTDTRAIERPDRWLSGKTPASDVDLDLLVEQFRPLVAASGWRVITDRVRTTALAGQEAQLPPERQSTYLAGYEDGRMLIGLTARSQLMLLVLRFATLADAHRFVADDREIRRHADLEVAGTGRKLDESTYSESAGPGGRLAGFSSVKRISPGALRIETQTGSIGPIVFSLIANDAPWLDRATTDVAVARFEDALKDPATARKAEKPPAVPIAKTGADAAPDGASVGGTVVVTVVDSAGKPVVKARVALSLGTGDNDIGEITALTDAKGRATLAVGRMGAARAEWSLFVERPLRRDDIVDEILSPWTPVDTTVTLVRGYAIDGVARDAKGRPLAGARVQARPTVRPAGATVKYATATSGVDGRFRLVAVRGVAHEAALVPDGEREPGSTAVWMPFDPTKSDALELAMPAR